MKALYTLLILIFLSHAVVAQYQPSSPEGSPSSDADPSFTGTDQQAGAAGADTSVTAHDGDSLAAEQDLSRENVTVRVNASEFDPNATLGGNYTVGTLGAAEKGSSVNGTEGSETDGAETVDIIGRLDRGTYYDVGSSLNATLYVRGTTDSPLTTDLGFRHAFGFYNGSWQWDSFSACTAFEITNANVYEFAANVSKKIDSSWTGAIEDNVLNYGVNVSVDTDDTCVAPNFAGTTGQTNTSAKNKTIQHRWKWVYSSDNGVTWSDGTTFSSWQNSTVKTTKTFTVDDHRAEASGDIDYYGLYVEVNGSDALEENDDLFNTTRNVTQSSLNLTQTSFATVTTTYFPSEESVNTTLWFRGELGYANGADANDYGGTGHDVNITLFKPVAAGHSLVESKFPTLNANGAFQVNFTLPARAQAGSWLVRVNYNSSSDLFTEATSNFTVRVVSNATRTYGFYGDNTSASYVRTNNTNLLGEIRIETYFFNNPESLTPVCNVTVASVTEPMTWNSTGGYCFRNTQAPSSIGEVNVSANFTLNTSTGRLGDGFSSKNATLNVTDEIVVNGTDASYDVYNLGDNVSTWGFVYNVRGEPLQGKTVTVRLANATGAIQISNGSAVLGSDGKYNFTFQINSTNSSVKNSTGEPYTSSVLSGSNRGNATDKAFSVSRLLTATLWADKQEDGIDEPNGTEDTVFAIDVDKVYVRTRAQAVNGNNWSATVYTTVKKSDGTFDEARNSWNNTTNSLGWTPFFTVNVVSPQGKRNVTVTANDSYGNEGTFTENVTWATNPAEVRINSLTDTTTPTISADVTITNEGSTDQEYQYEYCLVNASDNECGGSDDIAFGSGAKLLSPSASFNAILTLNDVTQTGSMFFRVDVAFGSEQSSASRSFTATSGATAAAEGVSGGGGGGGGGGAVVQKEPEKIVVREAEGEIEIVDYPRTFEIVKEESLEQIFEIKNSGAGELTNVRLVLSGLPLDSYEISPSGYVSIPPGGTATFTVRFRADLEAKEYQIKYIVLSDQGSQEVDARLVVTEEKGLLPSLGIDKTVTGLLLLVLVVLGMLMFEHHRTASALGEISRNTRTQELGRDAARLRERLKRIDDEFALRKRVYEYHMAGYGRLDIKSTFAGFGYDPALVDNVLDKGLGEECYGKERAVVEKKLRDVEGALRKLK